MSNPPTIQVPIPVQAHLQLGSEILDSLVEKLRPAIEQALTSALPAKQESNPPNGNAVEVSQEDRAKAKAIKDKILNPKLSVDDRLLVDAKTVAYLLHMSQRTLYRLMAIGGIPQPIKLTGKLVRWRADEIKAWVDADCPLAKDWAWPRAEDVQGTPSRKSKRT